MVAFCRDVGAEAVQFVDDHETVVEYVLGDEGRALADREQRQHLWLKVGGEPRVRQGRYLYADGPATRRGLHPACAFLTGLHVTARLAHLHRQHLQRRRVHALDPDRSARGGARYEVRAGLYTVAHHGVLGSGQRRDALDSQRRRTYPFDPRPHLVEEDGQVGYLRLPGDVLQYAGTLRHAGRHQQVLGGPHARELEADIRPRQAVRLDLDEPVRHLEVGAHLRQSLEVQVYLPGAYVAAAGHRDAGPAEPRGQRAQDVDRRPHPLHEVVRRLGLRRLGRPDSHRAAAERSAEAHVVEQLQHRADIRDVRDVMDGRRPVSHQRGRHELQRGVLGAACRDRPIEGALLDDVLLLHAVLSLRGPVSRCPDTGIITGEAPLMKMGPHLEAPEKTLKPAQPVSSVPSHGRCEHRER